MFGIATHVVCNTPAVHTFHPYSRRSCFLTITMPIVRVLENITVSIPASFHVRIATAMLSRYFAHCSSCGCSGNMLLRSFFSHHFHQGSSQRILHTLQANTSLAPTSYKIYYPPSPHPNTSSLVFTFFFSPGSCISGSFCPHSQSSRRYM